MIKAGTDHFRACLLGAAIGDALGKYKEGIPRSKADELYHARIDSFIPPAKDTYCPDLLPHQHTDDTDLIVLVAESILAKNGIDPFDLSCRLITWHDDPTTRKRYRGNATIEAIRKLKKLGVNSWWESGSLGDGCGAATRAIPIALTYAQDGSSLPLWVDIASIITHRNAVAVDGARVVAASLYLIANDHLPDPKHLAKVVRTPEFIDNLGTVSILINQRATLPDALAHIGTSVSAHHVVPLSLFLFLSNPDEFECVLDAANASSDHGCDTDSIACLTGAMLGLRKGLEVIPESLAKSVENSRKLLVLADSLHNQSISSEDSHWVDIGIIGAQSI